MHGPMYIKCKGHYDIAGIFRNVVLVTSGFHTQKNFSENHPQFGEHALNIFANPVPGQKKN